MRRADEHGAHRRELTLLAGGLALALALAGGGDAARAAGNGTGAGDLAEGEAELLPVDVVVRVINGTTRADGRAESVTLSETGQDKPVLAGARDVTGEVVLPHLFLDETRTYLVEAESGGTPYFAQATGHDLAAGPLTVYVFETTTDRAGLAVSELNLRLRRTETDLRLEYLITITNSAVPQRTVLPDPTSFELQLPDGAVGAAFEVLSGAAPQKTAAVAGQVPGRAALAVPLRSGTTRLRVTTSLPYNGRAHLVLASSLPVTEFTLLATPPDLRIDGDFTDAGEDTATGCRLWTGPALAADREVRWTVQGGSSPRIAARTAGGAAAPDGPARPLARVRRIGLSLAGWLVVVGAFAMVALALLARVRRRDRDRRDEPPTRRPRRRA
ncbi:MAG: hypothetical protein ACYDIE_13120 [Candidatus Krumholzibacteriia bacterium]